MFRISIIIGLLLAVLLMVLDVILFRGGKQSAIAPPGRNRWIKLLVTLSYLTAGLFFILTAISAFFHRLIFGEAMTGYLMVLHLIVGMVFFTAATAAFIFTANRHVFTFGNRMGADETIRMPEKICFWGIITSALIMSIAIFLCMLKTFDSEIHQVLVNIHRYSGVVLAIMIMFYSYRRLRMTILSSKKSKTV
ncbi:MAG: hypothetical protein JW709_14105 [Sedimentisphaerales bacterium]|nr:hypothetical protein [Sedimentisphaerales bacterium]